MLQQKESCTEVSNGEPSSYPDFGLHFCCHILERVAYNTWLLENLHGNFVYVQTMSQSHELAPTCVKA